MLEVLREILKEFMQHRFLHYGVSFYFDVCSCNVKEGDLIAVCFSIGWNLILPPSVGWKAGAL